MELLLLGAGAAVESEIPHAYKMTKVMVDMLIDEYRYQQPQIEKALLFVLGGLLFQQGIKGENPYDGVNIEDLFNAVNMLNDRQHSELTPFINSWHPQLVELAGGKFRGQNLQRAIYEPIEYHLEKLRMEINDVMGNEISYRQPKIGPPFSSNFEESFSNAVRQVMTGEGERIFEATAYVMIKKLVKIVWVTDAKKVDHLTQLVRYAHKTNSTIVTLNYDNTIEMAGKVTDVGIDTGFDSWSTNGAFSFAMGKVPLIKLHGSIDWALSERRVSKEQPLPSQVIKKVDINDYKKDDYIHPAVVFGGKNKLKARGPFLSLIRAFEQRLSVSDVLTVIGYSFRDEHVNEFITNWFNGDMTRRIRIINPDMNSLTIPSPITG